MEIQTTTNINSISSNHHISDSTLSPTSKGKRKRRSKKDPNGRMFICQCGKGYLSKLALNNHIKSKHQQMIKVSSNKTPFFLNQSSKAFNSNLKKKRGRPKKSFDILTNDEVLYSTFFDNLKRKKTQKYNNNILLQQNGNFTSFISDIFKSIYIEHKKLCAMKVNSLHEHKFINKIEKFLLKGEKEEDLDKKENVTCDDIFIEYICFIYPHINEDYLKFSIKFILLLRECINKYKNVELENTKEVLEEKNHLNEEKEFTEIYDGEQIPEICNEFLTEFLTSADYFGEKDQEARLEYQNIIQHFCYWLYEHNFTSSKLILNKINE